jgi:hypothetical protein
MRMQPYPVLCYAPGCGRPAAFKIAARWSDGTTHELKTYSLACAECLSALFASATERRRTCRLAPGETLDAPEVYELNRGARDRELVRRIELERTSPA